MCSISEHEMEKTCGLRLHMGPVGGHRSGLLSQRGEVGEGLWEGEFTFFSKRL